MTKAERRGATCVLACLFALAMALAGCGAETGSSGQPCSKVADCPVAKSECDEVTCLDGVCGTRPHANGSDAPTQKDGDCKKNICAGGDSIVVEDSADVPAGGGNPCIIEGCNLGAPAGSSAPAGAQCDDAGGVCDGAGKCVACVEDADCGAKEVCTPQHTCVSSACMNGEKDGDETDVDCGGSCGATCEDGAGCGGAKDCVNAQCADGVCCDSACDGECQACSAAKTGKADGVCAPFDAGTDPDDECAPEPGVACGNTDGMCSGQGACNKIAAGTACGGGPACVDDVATAEAACDGAGTCVPGPGTPCAPYKCDATDCKKACAGDADCTASSFCQGSICMPVGDPGDPCASGAWCKSGSCADGVCCDAACDGACQACVAVKKGAGEDGLCGPVATGTDPDDDCAGPEVCSAAGACKVALGEACANANGCASGFCTDGVCCDALCSTSCQSCLGAQTGSPFDGVCGPIMGGIDPADECAGALVCNGMGACGKLTNGAACAAAGDCASGLCADGVCCNAACDTTCVACTAAKKGGGTNGQCGSISAGQDPDGECFGATACNGNGACQSFPVGQACAQGPECASGFCVDGFCCSGVCSAACQACSAVKRGPGGTNGQCGAIATGTDPDAECAGALVCDAAGGCTLPNGEACSAGAQCVSGFCADGVCCNAACAGPCAACTATKKGTGADGACGSIQNGLDPDSECAGATSCNGNAACATFTTGTACTLAAECASGFCADGFCCNSACATACQACSAAKRGGGTNGQCGAIATGTDPDAECAGALVCDAAGACKLPDAQSCAANAECVGGFCVDGVCCNTACGASCMACSNAKKGFGPDGVCGNIQNGLDPDSECGGATVCNGSAACALLPVGTACGANNECQSVACVDGFCCGSACSSPCEACSAAKKGSGTNGTCGAILSGLDPDSECAGLLVCNGANACKMPNGGVCAANAECLGGFCADGVCCNTACSGACQACTAAKKGSGADGTCGNIVGGTDPDSECSGNASCSGAGACLLLTNGMLCSLNTECQSAQCVDGVCCNTTCSGLCQACSAAKKGSGADGTCGNVAVSTDPDSECPGATSCNGTVCALFANGSLCTLNAECSSGQCADGVCCNGACNGLCQACTTAKKGSGTDGACGNIGAGTDPDNECAGALSCNGAGVCN